MTLSAPACHDGYARNDPPLTLSDLISEADHRQLETLWKSTGEDPSAPGSHHRLRNFTTGLAKLLGGVDCWWLVASQRPTPSDVFSFQLFDGWAILDVVSFNPLIDAERNYAAYMEMAQRHGCDPQSEHAVRSAGETRALLRRDIASDEEWDGHWKVREFLIPCYGIKERMHAIHSVAPGIESYLLIDRALDAPPFGERERQLAYLATSGASSLHRRLCFERGLLPPASKVLAPRERETLELLLTELSEKEIAETLGVTVRTAHQYVTSIYRIFGVSGRAGLFSLWIRTVA